jgi:hypothetical protein
MIGHKLVLTACTAVVMSTAACAHSDPDVAIVTPEDVERLRSNLERAAMAQEIHYSYPPNNSTYASDAGRLMQFRADPDTRLTIFEGTQKGWSGMVQLASGAACVIYIGQVAETPRTPRGAVASAPKAITCDEAT